MELKGKIAAAVLTAAVTVIGIWEGRSLVADMDASNPGTWMFKCNVGDHIHAGMMSLYTVEPR